MCVSVHVHTLKFMCVSLCVCLYLYVCVLIYLCHIPNIISQSIFIKLIIIMHNCRFFIYVTLMFVLLPLLLKTSKIQDLLNQIYNTLLNCHFTLYLPPILLLFLPPPAVMVDQLGRLLQLNQRPPTTILQLLSTNLTIQWITVKTSSPPSIVTSYTQHLYTQASVSYQPAFYNFSVSS